MVLCNLPQKAMYYAFSGREYNNRKRSCLVCDGNVLMAFVIRENRQLDAYSLFSHYSIVY